MQNAGNSALSPPPRDMDQDKQPLTGMHWYGVTQSDKSKETTLCGLVCGLVCCPFQILAFILYIPVCCYKLYKITKEDNNPPDPDDMAWYR